MIENELVKDMYSCLNLVVNELNSIGLNKLGDLDIVRKTISVLPQKKYTSIITILRSLDDLSNMTLAMVIGKVGGIWNEDGSRSHFFKQRQSYHMWRVQEDEGQEKSK